MDNEFINKNRQAILEMCRAKYPENAVYAIVGSLVRDDFTEKSDCDIVIFTRNEKVYGHAATGTIGGRRYMIMHKPISDCNKYRGYELSWYDLEKQELHIGKGDAAFLSQRAKYREDQKKWNKS